MRKGVTPVVATVLLMAVTFAAAGTLYGVVQNRTQVTQDSVDDSNLPLNINSLRVETCYNEGGETHIVLRNAAVNQAINATRLTPILNGTIERNYNIEPEIVSPQSTFTLNFSKTFGPSTQIILTDGQNKVKYSCYNL